MYRGFDMFREMMSGPRHTLVAGHDPDVLLRYPKHDPNLTENIVRVG
jgi:hypothetical protein